MTASFLSGAGAANPVSPTALDQGESAAGEAACQLILGGMEEAQAVGEGRVVKPEGPRLPAREGCWGPG